MRANTDNSPSPSPSLVLSKLLKKPTGGGGGARGFRPVAEQRAHFLPLP